MKRTKFKLTLNNDYYQNVQYGFVLNVCGSLLLYYLLNSRGEFNMDVFSLIWYFITVKYLTHPILNFMKNNNYSLDQILYMS